MKSATVWIFGGRDVGKTTVAMHTVAELRWMGIPTALPCGFTELWGEVSPIVNMRIFTQSLDTFTPHKVATMCRDSLNFLILRPKYYWDNPPTPRYRPRAWL